MTRPALPAGAKPPGVLALPAGSTPSAGRTAAEPPSIAARLTSLERVMGVLDGRVDAQHLSSARNVTRQITERLSLSPAHTVVALAGATGSGKSSLFNALAGLDLSEVGVRRPVTNAPHACVWGPDGAGPLLDWLSIPYDNRTGRESALDADTQVELRGLVLLDLPDHDSTQLAHRLEVDRLVELVDLLVWVLDPQKYADEAVHARYLRRLSRHAGVTVVALNQIDLLSRADQEACLADVRRLLDADGLRGVPLVPLSALRGDGMPELKAKITAAVGSRRTSLQRLAADLDDVADELAPLAGPEIREDVDRRTANRLYTTLAEAAGVAAVGEAVERGYRFTASRNMSWPLIRWFGRVKVDPLAPLRDNPGRSRRHSTARPAVLHPVQRPQVEEALRHLSEDTANGLPDPWPRLVHRAARTELDGLPDALDRAVADADLGLARRPTWWWAYRVAQFLLVAGLFAGVVWVLGIGISTAVSGTQHTPSPKGLALPIGLLFVGLLLGPALHLIGIGLAARGSQLARLRAEQAVLDAVTTVAREKVLVPARAELSAYAQVRDALIEFGVPALQALPARSSRSNLPASAALGSSGLKPALETAGRPDPVGIRALPAPAADQGLGPGPTSTDPRFSARTTPTGAPGALSRPIPPAHGPVPPPVGDPVSTAGRPLPPPPVQGPPPSPGRPTTAAGRRRERMLPPAPPPRPAVEADPEVMWERSRPAMPPTRAGNRPAPPPPPAGESSRPTAGGSPAPTSAPPASGARPPTVAGGAASASGRDTPTGPSQAADPLERPSAERRKSLRGLLGARRSGSADEVERWWAGDDDGHDPFAGPPTAEPGTPSDHRPGVPGQR